MIMKVSDSTLNLLAKLFFIAIMTAMSLYLLANVNEVRKHNRQQKEKDAVCVGNCPPPGPMDCTIYGRKPDGSWPTGFECSSTP